MQEALAAHLKTGSTTVCRAWKVQRHDGVILGFTDHDDDLAFEEVVFVARSGLTARALQQTTGMSVDNTEAVGALTDASVREEDIIAGRYDSAEVTTYLVNWAKVEERSILFRGTFGEITRVGGAFQVELRGLTERLNLSGGRVYHSKCSANLGDVKCRADLTLPGRALDAEILGVEDGRVLRIASLPDLHPQWFSHGQATLMSGVGVGQTGFVRSDADGSDGRIIELWQGFGLSPAIGDQVRLVVGCNKTGSTCRTKFDNFLNFRGFPHIPGEDWLRSGPNNSARR